MCVGSFSLIPCVFVDELAMCSAAVECSDHPYYVSRESLAQKFSSFLPRGILKTRFQKSVQ